jgi:hypothetical protein
MIWQTQQLLLRAVCDTATHGKGTINHNASLLSNNNTHDHLPLAVWTTSGLTAGSIGSTLTLTAALLYWQNMLMEICT